MTSRKIFNFILILITAFTFFSCSKDSDKEKVTDKKDRQEDEIDNPADTVLSPEEMFSSALLVDYLNDSEDEDLDEYLQTEVYKMGSNFTGISVIEATPSTWLVIMDSDSTTKNYLLQKFFNVKSNTNYFKMKETTLTVTDIINRGKVKTSAGD